MGEENEVVLFGLWSSPFVRIVHLALRLKKVAFEYVEEDLRNKSPQLLKYNPVHKKVPVLVHNGKPIVESLIIAEYIDETWNQSPPLLPQDPYKRAKVRFWSSFIMHQMIDSMFTVLKTDGEEQEKAMKEVSEKLELLEEGVKELVPDGSCPIDNESMGLLDLLFCSLFGSQKVPEEVHGMKMIHPEKTPLLYSRIAAINQLPLVIELTPPHDKMVSFLKVFRENALKSSST